MAAKPDYDVSTWADGLDALSADELHGRLQGYKVALETTGLSPHHRPPTVNIMGAHAFVRTIASYADRADNVGESALQILHLFFRLARPPANVLDILLTSPHTNVCAAYLVTYFTYAFADASAKARLCVANTYFMDRLVASLRDSGKGQVLVEELAHVDDDTRTALLNYPGLVEALFSVLSSGMESGAAACALQQMPNDIALSALCLPETRVPVFLAAIGASLGTNDGMSVKLLRCLADDEGIRKQIHDDNFVVTELARLLGNLPLRNDDDENEIEPVVVLFEICAVEPIPSHELVGNGPAGSEGDILGLPLLSPLPPPRHARQGDDPRVPRRAQHEGRRRAHAARQGSDPAPRQHARDRAAPPRMRYGHRVRALAAAHRGLPQQRRQREAGGVPQAQRGHALPQDAGHQLRGCGR
jgi:hypothetical protein